jgi:hypothetical protein
MSIFSESTQLQVKVLSQLESKSAATDGWSISVPVTGTPDGARFCVGFQCNNMPTDGRIVVIVPGPDADDTVNFIGNITHPNMGMMWSVVWKPNQQSGINIVWMGGNTAPPQGANIQAVVAYPVGL